MKNHLWIAMALAAVLMTTGCAGKGAQNQTQAPAEQAQEQVQEETQQEAEAPAEQAQAEGQEQAQAEAQDQTQPEAQEQAQEGATVEQSQAEPAATLDYSSEENWAYYSIGDDKDVDLFLICPTVDMLDEENMSMENEVMK